MRKTDEVFKEKYCCVFNTIKKMISYKVDDRPKVQDILSTKDLWLFKVKEMKKNPQFKNFSQVWKLFEKSGSFYLCSLAN
jgi:hypothetical protein